MQLLKGIVLGLLVNKGFGQTDPLPTGEEEAVATVAEPVATDAPDPPVLEPSVPQPDGQCNRSPFEDLEATEGSPLLAYMARILLTIL
jgi:hypothetical protein